jgi:ZIP family zinc transporter
MSNAQTILLGAIAGATVFIGLPLARVRGLSSRARAFLNAFATGILLFLLFDILANAIEPLEGAVERAGGGTGAWSTVAGFAAVFVAGLSLGLLSLLYLGKAQLGTADAEGASAGPGAMAVTEAASSRRALQLGMSIAAGIGLHNFSEGLAIGQSARVGQLSLALLLVIGFALHNATEGFGIVGPLAANDVRAPWSYLVAVGLVAGGPTFVGTIVGTAFTSEYVFVLFLSLAAGAIIYVIAQLLHTGRRMSWETTVWGLLVGFLVALGTELVLVAAGA